jgi:two-component system sensor histidine kinase/response regulator
VAVVGRRRPEALFGRDPALSPSGPGRLVHGLLVVGVRAQLADEVAHGIDRRQRERGPQLRHALPQVSMLGKERAHLLGPGRKEARELVAFLALEPLGQRSLGGPPGVLDAVRIAALQSQHDARKQSIEGGGRSREWTRGQIRTTGRLIGRGHGPVSRNIGAGPLQLSCGPFEGRQPGAHGTKREHAQTLHRPAARTHTLMPDSPASDNAQTTVLVVDDNEANRALARHTLEDEGYRVVVAKDGQEGLALFALEKPDCVLLDVRMPELDGFAVCERIRALPRGPETPVVFLTALRDVDTFDHALRSGGDDFLTKPVRPTELVIRVQSALKIRRLSAELREHYDLLRHQRDDLLRVQLQKERLMAFVVHDLKNPVNAMDLHAQLLARDASLPASARESAAQIRIAARRLGQMILNLLDISKADEGKLVASKTPVDLEALAARVTAEIDVAARARGCLLEVALTARRVDADEDLLERTLLNLLENAVRHAPGGTAVRLESRREGPILELRVRDAGPGIPEAMRETLFDPFVQLGGEGHPPSRGGRGLGLAFCRLAVQAHGGRIWIEDGNPGAVFVLALPAEGS